MTSTECTCCSVSLYLSFFVFLYFYEHHRGPITHRACDHDFSSHQAYSRSSIRVNTSQQFCVLSREQSGSNIRPREKKLRFIGLYRFRVAPPLSGVKGLGFRSLLSFHVPDVMRVLNRAARPRFHFSFWSSPRSVRAANLPVL